PAVKRKCPAHGVPSSSLFSLSKAHPGQTYRFSLLRLCFLPASSGRLPHLAPSLRLPGFPSRTVAPSFPLFCQKVPLYWSKLRKKKKGCSPPRRDVFRKQPRSEERRVGKERK